MLFDAYDLPELPCIDTGFYLTHSSYDDDEQEVVDRAFETGLVAMVALGIDLPSSEAALAASGRHSRRVYAAVGVHPNAASRFDGVTHARLRELAVHSSTLAIGLCGLDLEHRNAPRQSEQERCLRAQLELAIETSLPLLMTVRGAHARAQALLAPHRLELGPVVIHDFAGTRPELEAWLELGCHIAFSGRVCDPRRGEDLRSLLGSVPAGRLLLCSDAPFAPPLDLSPRVRRNEPCFLPHVLQTIAKSRGEEAMALARLVVASSREVLGLRLDLGTVTREPPSEPRYHVIIGASEGDAPE